VPPSASWKYPFLALFRQDLLYRLHDFEITVPPLRECQEDIMPLADFFREIANQEIRSLSSASLRRAKLTGEVGFVTASSRCFFVTTPS